jgi:hypothetical protein
MADDGERRDQVQQAADGEDPAHVWFTDTDTS